MTAVILFCASRGALALDPNKPFSQYGLTIWTKDNGLPTNAVLRSIQTRDGYIWFGTQQDGLLRFNGSEFKAFNKKNSPGLNDNAIYSLLESRDGSLWIGTSDGLTRYKNGKFVTYAAESGLPTGPIISIHEHSDGVLWLGVYGAGICSFQNGKVRLYDNKDGLPNKMIFAMASADDGGIWVGTYGAGLFKFKDGVFTPFKDPLLEDDRIVALFRTREGDFLVGRFNGLFSFKDGIFTEIKPFAASSFGSVNQVFEDPNGAIWVSDIKGLARLNHGHNDYYDLKSGPLKAKACSFLMDREGSLWVTTQDNGIGRFRDNKFTVYGGAPAEQDEAWGLAPSNDGNLWALKTELMAKFKDGVISEGSRPTIRFSESRIMSFVEAKDGAIWLATIDGVKRFKSGVWTIYTTKDGLPNNLVFSITETRKGDIWVGTRTGLARLDGNRFIAYEQADSSEMIDITELQEGHDGSLLMLTLKGLGIFKDGRLTLYGADKGLGGTHLTSLYENPDGSIWLTSDGGLIHFKDGIIKRYTAKDGLPDEELLIITDAVKDFWIIGRNAIFRINQQELNDFTAGIRTSFHTIRYGIYDGAPSLEDLSVAKTNDGKLWFSSKKGIYSIDPGNIGINQLPPPVMIEEVIIDKRDINPGAYARLQPGSGEIEFSYSALSFVAPEMTKFKYMLEGFDKGWIDPGTRKTAHYTNIPPGEYSFRVIACNNDGVWNESGASFKFYLLPHFYQTYWFYAVCGLAAIFLAALGHHLRIRQLKVREKELGKRVEDALAQVKVLSGLLPICASCKNIREGEGQWTQMESYIQRHSQADFSHGICPDCIRKLYPEMAEMLLADD